MSPIPQAPLPPGMAEALGGMPIPFPAAAFAHAPAPAAQAQAPKGRAWSVLFDPPPPDVAGARQRIEALNGAMRQWMEITDNMLSQAATLLEGLNCEVGLREAARFEVDLDRVRAFCASVEAIADQFKPRGQ